MNVISGNNLTNQIKKENFQLKPVQRDGLILQIHNTVPNNLYKKQIRFLHATFDHSGLILASSDIDGNIFITDFACTKYWAITKLPVCSTIAFNILNNDELIVASKDGVLHIVNIHLGTILGSLQGHSKAVISISFAQEQCLTASSSQAIIYNINTLEKLHELCINANAKIKQMFFMPVTHHILACFADDYIHVWKNGSFESFKKLLPSEWNKFTIKTIAITRNGTTMVIGGLSSKLIVFSLDSWLLTRILNLSDEMNVKRLDFLSQSHDGGANKFIIVLTTNGIINLLDMEQSVVIAKIHQPSEILSFACSTNGTHLSCVLRSGEVNIHKMSPFMDNSVSSEVTVGEPVELASKSSKLKLFLPMAKPREELNLSKLQDILKEYGEYPENYRTLIWTKILLLPYNINNYSAISSKGLNPAFSHIEGKYPLENKLALKNFKRLLSNLANWSPAVCSMEFLPLFVFPFGKIFENDPVICFEAVMSIIMNWCQHWFEYAPVPPVNILAMIENVFRDHDSQLLAQLNENNVTCHLYAWSLLETGFSEVLTIKEWCILWDHILSNEPSFLLMIPVAYNIINRTVLSQINSLSKFQAFYHNQNAIPFKRFISKIYFLKKFTRNEIHPRQYLNNFKPLVKDCYPLFEGGPKVIITATETVTTATAVTSAKIANRKDHIHTADVKILHSGKISGSDVKRSKEMTDACGDKIPARKANLNNKTGTTVHNSQTRPATGRSRLRGGVEKMTNCVCKEEDDDDDDDNDDDDDSITEYNQCPILPFNENDIEAIEEEINKVQRRICKINRNKSKQNDVNALKREEANRIKMLQSLLQEKLFKEKMLADKRKIELSCLKTKLYDMQAESIENTHKKLETINLDERKRELENILHEIDALQQQDELDIQRTEEELSRHYVELLKQKSALENILLQSVDDDETLNANYAVIDEQRQTVNEELQKMRKSIRVARVKTKLNVSSRILVENVKLNKADVALAREMAHKQRQISMCNSNIQLLKMEQDTKSLEGEVEQLLEQFSHDNKQKYKCKMSKIKDSVSHRRRLINKELELTSLRKLNNGKCPDDMCEECCANYCQS